jgi:hypothetical protein
MAGGLAGDRVISLRHPDGQGSEILSNLAVEDLGLIADGSAVVYSLGCNVTSCTSAGCMTNCNLAVKSADGQELIFAHMGHQEDPWLICPAKASSKPIFAFGDFVLSTDCVHVCGVSEYMNCKQYDTVNMTAELGEERVEIPPRESRSISGPSGQYRVTNRHSRVRTCWPGYDCCASADPHLFSYSVTGEPSTKSWLQ